MDETLFYVFGIALVVSAVGVAAIGLRFDSFPPSRGVLAGTIAYFTVLVAVTAFFAVRNAQDEQRHREAEQAEEAEQASATTTEGTETTTAAPEGGGGTIQLAADPSELAFDTTSLTAQPGTLTIDFDNPNDALPHDVCVESSSGSQLGCSEQVTGGQTTLEVKDLKPGSYTFYCDVPGHEESGMKGTLTVE